MSRLEDDLRQALERQEPPAGFTDRVLARVKAEEAQPTLWQRLNDLFRMPALRMATAAVLCIVLAIGVTFEQQRRTREQGEAAKEKLLLALKITSSKLHTARSAVQAISEE